MGLTHPLSLKQSIQAVPLSLDRNPKIAPSRHIFPPFSLFFFLCPTLYLLNIFLQHFICFGSRARRPPRVSSFLRNFTNKSLAESWKNMFMLFIWEVISFRSRAVHMLSIIQITGGFAQSISTIAAGVSPPCGSSEQLVKQGARRGIPRDDTCTTSNREGVQICTLHYSSL